MTGRLRSSFKLEKSFTPIYTGGAIAASADGSRLYSTLNEEVVVTDVHSGSRLQVLQGDTSAVTTLAVSPENASAAGTLLVAHRSLAIRFYSIDGYKLLRSVARAHDAPITVAAADPTGSLFATGSADGIVKVWDAVQGHCTHVFKGHGGVISALCFDTTSQYSPRLATASDDCRIRIWDLGSRKSLFLLEGHSSVVRGLVFKPNGEALVSGGRDKVFNVWNLRDGSLLRSIPVYETLEAIGLIALPSEVEKIGTHKGKEREENLDKRLAIWTAGDSGVLKAYTLDSGRRISLEESLPTTGRAHEIVTVCCLADCIITAHVDQNIIFHELPTFRPLRQLVGYNDEVVDVVFLSPFAARETDGTATETHFAVATNSDIIRMYSLQHYNTVFLRGHDDVILSLARNQRGSLLMSGSKDRTARVWAAIQPSKTLDPEWHCIGICEGHVQSVGAVAMARRGGLFAATASQDRTVKIWDLSSLNPMLDSTVAKENITPTKLLALTTLKVHDKDINALDISPNDHLLATASQDKTAKLFAVEYSSSTRAQPQPKATLIPLGIFKGHKRGVWSVRFSPAEQCLATASGDRTIKLWNINDFTCLKTFEGHTNTVLRADFLPLGRQMVSCAADGLLKIWTTKDEDCIATVDAHDDKIWSIAQNQNATLLVSGGADSVINVWKDVTEEEEEEQAAAAEKEVLQMQDLSNFIGARDYRNAILLALSMNHPRRLLSLFQEIFSATEESGDPLVSSILATLESGDVHRLLGYIREWNTKSRDAEVAQRTLHLLLQTQSTGAILKAHSQFSVLEAPNEQKNSGRDESLDLKDAKVSDILEALQPYTERHYARVVRLDQESAFLDFVLCKM